MMGVQLKNGKASAENSLADRIARNQGWLSFQNVMEFALYDPSYGYYTTQIREVGRRGDFSTSAHEASILGRAIAAWATKRRRCFGKKWHLIEMGGGNGMLAETVLRSLGFLGRMGMRAHMVEVSEPLRNLQKKKLNRYGVSWHNSIREALDAANGEALIFSNELVDAYPCRKFLKTDAGWSESGVMIENERLRESVRAISRTEIAGIASSAFAMEATDHAIEVHDSYRQELGNIAQHLRKGNLLTIDYGDRYPAIYYRQPRGTVRGYFHHLRIDGPELFTRLGKQDITADVNFSDLENWGTMSGLRNDFFQTQRDFILQWLGKIQPKTTDEARLLDPAGAGGAFKVLEQSRNLDS